MSGQNENATDTNQYRTSRFTQLLEALSTVEQYRTVFVEGSIPNDYAKAALTQLAELFDLRVENVVAIGLPFRPDGADGSTTFTDEAAPKRPENVAATHSLPEWYHFTVQMPNGDFSFEGARRNPSEKPPFQTNPEDQPWRERKPENVPVTDSPPDEDDTPHPDPLTRALYELAVVKHLFVSRTVSGPPVRAEVEKRTQRAYEALREMKRNRDMFGPPPVAPPTRVNITYFDPPALLIKPGEVAQFTFGTGHIRATFGRTTGGKKAYEFYQVDEAVDDIDAVPTQEDRAEWDDNDTPRIRLVFEDDAAIHRMIRHLAQLGGMSP